MTIRGSDEGVRLAAELLVRLIEGTAPPAVVAAHLSAQVAGHPTLNHPEGVRRLAIGSVLRRIALKAVCLAFSDVLRDACCNLPLAALEARSSCSSAYTHGRYCALAPLF